MARVCEICNKKGVSGHNVSYSKRRTPRRFEANLRTANLKINDTDQKVKLCMKCLKKAKNEGRVVLKRAVSKTPATK